MLLKNQIVVNNHKVIRYDKESKDLLRRSMKIRYLIFYPIILKRLINIIEWL